MKQLTMFYGSFMTGIRSHYVRIQGPWILGTGFQKALEHAPTLRPMQEPGRKHFDNAAYPFVLKVCSIYRLQLQAHYSGSSANDSGLSNVPENRKNPTLPSRC